jgi:hypothetical protein
VLPTLIKIVDIVIVATTYLVGNLGGVVVIYGTSLVVRLNVFVDESVDKFILGELAF